MLGQRYEINLVSCSSLQEQDYRVLNSHAGGQQFKFHGSIYSVTLHTIYQIIPISSSRGISYF